MPGRFTVYGDLRERDTIVLMTVLSAKGLEPVFVEQSPSLVFALAARAGRQEGPFLRTPEGFVQAGNAEILDWIERVHAMPALRPRTPVRRACSRLLELWIDHWLPLWPRRSWGTLEGIGAHLRSAGFLLGAQPTLADWILAAWLETEVLVVDHARVQLGRTAPRLLELGRELLASGVADAVSRDESDDAIPISLLDILAEMARDQHAYLRANQAALKDRSDRVRLDLGSGARAFATSEAAERRRVVLGLELAALDAAARRDVRSVLEPVQAWSVTTLPAALDEFEAGDPRGL